MANDTSRPSTGPFSEEVVTPSGAVVAPEGDGFGEDGCVYIPKDNNWYPAANCYTQIPNAGNSYGGTWCHYGNHYNNIGGGVYAPSLPFAANPLNGQTWDKFTIWWASDQVSDFHIAGNGGKMLGLFGTIGLGFRSDKDQFWHWTNEGGIYNELPRQWYNLDIKRPTYNDNGDWVSWTTVASFVTEFLFRKGFLFPVYKWHGVVMSCDLTNGYFHCQFRNFHTGQLWDFDHLCGFSGEHSAGDPNSTIQFMDFTAHPNAGGYNQATWQSIGGYRSSYKTPSHSGFQIVGCMAQFGFHNDYMDVSVDSNFNKFFCSDGIKDVGRQAEGIWGVPVKFFSETSDATRNKGTLDFSDNGLFSYHHPGKSTALMPTRPPEGQPVGGGVKLGTCVKPNDYMEGLFAAIATKEPHQSVAAPYEFIPFRSASNAHLDEATYPNTGFRPTGWLHGLHPMYANGYNSGWSITTRTTGDNGSYAIYASSDDPAWWPFAGNTASAWKNDWSPLAGSFAPNEGNDPWQMVIIISLWNKVGNTNPSGFFCLGDSYIGGGAGDGYSIIRVSETDGSNPQELRVTIPDGAGGQQQIFSGDQISEDYWQCIQVRYDPDEMELGIKINGNAWTYTALTNKITKPTSGAWIGGIYSNGGISTGYTGRLGQFYFYHGLKTDLESDGYWNDSRMTYFDRDTEVIAEVPEVVDYNPAMMSLNVGKAAGMYKSGKTVVTQNFTMIGRIYAPADIDGTSGTGDVTIITRSFGLSNHYMTLVGSSNGAYVTYRNAGSINNSISSSVGIDDIDWGLVGSGGADWISDGSLQGHEMRNQYINFALSFSPTFNRLYVWSQMRGWMRSSSPPAGGAAAAYTILHANYATLGGYGSGATGVPFMLSHFGYSTVATDFDIAFNRDLFFDPVTGFAKQLDETTWAEWGGVQPLMWSPDGDVANHIGSDPQWVPYGSAQAVSSIRANDIFVPVNPT